MDMIQGLCFFSQNFKHVSSVGIFFSSNTDCSEGRRIFVIFQLEILKPGNEVDFWIGQPVRLNPEAANNLVDVMLDSEISKEQKNDDAHDDDGIHFREFEDLDLFR